ncbi:MAG: SDR family NAD(P)-dependent oxidoreductase [Gemmataceae bacterium]
MSTYGERFSICDRRALVTGASKGIGAEVAAVLAEAGADLALVGRDREGLERTRATVETKGKQCLVIEADLSTVDGPRQAAAAALARFGTIDILVNNAGLVHVEKLLNITLTGWEETLAVNLRAPLLLAQLLAPKMIEQRRGKIIHISSAAGVIGIEGHGAYAASKGGLNMLTRVMACEWGPFNIQTNAIAPTVILTAMGQQVWGDPAKGDPMKNKIPLRRFGQPVEVADLVLFLASSASDFICGEVVMLDGGVSVV